VEIKEVLARPYRRVLIPDSESGTFTALIAEFPGCVSEGDTPSEAYDNIEDAAGSWVEAALESGIPIPEPESEAAYSGRVVLRMPRSTHRRAAEAAKADGVSLNTFLVEAIGERLGRHIAKEEAAPPKGKVRAIG